LQAKQRFDFFHFAGDGSMSFYPLHYPMPDPPDIVEWKVLGKKIAYTISGCLSCASQTSVAKWSKEDSASGKSVCDKCIWQDRPIVCNDKKNLDWGMKVEKYVDLTFAETSPPLDYLNSSKVIFEPVTTCLDPVLWNPNLAIPKSFRIERKVKEILIYHAMGNYTERSDATRNIKGTPAVFAAVEKLRAEGFPVRLLFFTNVKNKEIRFLQAQADIIVDQLNYGRYGATAREGMMLGKPVICYLNRNIVNDRPHPSALLECPLVSATEETVYLELKALVLNMERTREIGRQGREYAMKWHSADACAERYEHLYDTFIKKADCTHRELKG
jgi:hypothetical protein